MFLTESVNGNIAGTSVGSLAEILYEAEASYGNIVRRMMMLEHKAIITEDTALLESSVNGWIETFKAWVKKWFAKIKAFFAHMWDRISAVFTSDDKWIKEFKKKTFGKAEDVTVYPNVANGTVVALLEKAAKGLEAGAKEITSFGAAGADTDGGMSKHARDAVLTAAGANKDADSVTEAVRELILGGDDTSKETISDTKSFVAHFEAIVALGKGVKNLRKALDKCESDCNKALSKANSAADERGDARKNAEYQKAVAMVMSSALSAYTSCLGTARGQVKSILFAGSAASRKDSVKALHGESSTDLFAGLV